ncbi:diaminopimelate epimerase [Arcticibacterium luteifluviistationis]|uniref:Diaminopimelate epimerase n=1 Tax=Arcticibacterium luteifluviistationis TaxID=1784714 RepID=A0A2Z4GA60_9BACT|nr:diaminopimelate epimerase [Arcticibacterium luteifluviistationis]AWV98087.1 diaminopimelate epimerase [Arcticibacterium luteifluviistationis]
MKFFKYQGTGNDFIMIDDREQTFNLSKAEIEMLCHRRFGVGADGLILIQDAEGYDFRMVYYNADGGEGSMCGNGGRCIVRFAHDLGIFDKETSFIAVDGKHEASVTPDLVSLKMSDTAAVSDKDGLHFYDTGSPHVIKYIDNLDELDVDGAGSAIRNSEFWKVNGGTNVNFVEAIDEQRIKVRTYERGVEAETFSCGTGVTACVLDRFVVAACQSPIAIVTKGGDLEVSFHVNADHSFTNIYLIGPAKRVFEGVLA